MPREECRRKWTLAYVSWLYPHPKRCCIGKPAEWWCDSLSEPFGIHSFVTPDLLLSRCAHGPFTMDDESLLVVVPLSVWLYFTISLLLLFTLHNSHLQFNSSTTSISCVSALYNYCILCHHKWNWLVSMECNELYRHITAPFCSLYKFASRTTFY